MISTEGFAHIAKKRFELFLDTQGYRKTPERFAVMDELFAHEGHLDADGLFLIMRNKNYSISRATIYNTLDLLVECGLAAKHHFKNKNALYEQSLIYQHHNHFVCNDCNKIKEFSDPRLEDIKESVGKELGSTIILHSLVFYGDCTIADCENKRMKTES